MTLTDKKKINLVRIETARHALNIYLENGFITEEDILHLLKVKSDYGFKYKDKVQTYKKCILRDIFNSPFILCDQDSLSLNVKQLLPIILKSRYDKEIDELKYMLENGFINKEEYIEEEKLMKYNYYGSSKDGKSILKNGHVDNLLDNKIKVR